MQKKRITNILSLTKLTSTERTIADKVLENQRITQEEGIYLFYNSSLHFLGLLANYIRENLNGKDVYFNKNIHIEPTNICIYNCKFCSYKRRFGDTDAWDHRIEDILEMVKKYEGKDITEIHITGGVHPHYNLLNHCTVIKKIKDILPKVHIKAFTAVEIDYMCKKAMMSIEDGIDKLKECGLDSLPGGGAEIFNPEIRQQISLDKSDARLWLRIHKIAHSKGLKSNATILYGHIEKYEDRIDHISQIRELQDETGGFNAFIPLKFRNANNKLSHIPELSVTEDMRNYAITRIFLDNIKHIKAYWVMLGRSFAQMSLSYGVDDLDGTIDNSTKIYTMAGSEEQKPTMTSQEMVDLIKSAGLTPVERDSLYNTIKIYK